MRGQPAVNASPLCITASGQFGSSSILELCVQGKDVLEQLQSSVSRLTTGPCIVMLECCVLWYRKKEEEDSKQNWLATGVKFEDFNLRVFQMEGRQSMS